MSKKRNTERYIKSTVKRYFKRINKEKEYTFLILLGIFTTLVLYNPTFEKVGTRLYPHRSWQLLGDPASGQQCRQRTRCDS